MTRTRTKNETKRKQILDAATQLFTEQGYAATSMDLIAKISDVSKQTVYSHFGNKEELFSAAITQKCHENQFDVLSEVDLTNPYETLLTIAQRFFALISSKEALAVHRICAFESKTYPQLSALFYQAGPEKLIGEMTKLMVRISDLAEYQIANPNHAAVQFVSMIKGEAWCRLELNLAETLSSQEVAEYLENSVQFFLRGYRA
ncbi:TetR/AcrR family transcriptional regulator [Thalassotalea agariperforans]